MTARSILKGAAFALPLILASPALAQEGEEGPPPEDRNSLTIGVGGAYIPTYEGSDNYQITPIGIAFGSVGGISFATRGTGITIDLIPDDREDPVSFDLGPAGHVRLDRTGGIKDPQVRALGEIDTAIELGGFAGLKINGLLHQYDSLGFRLQYLKDVSNTHDSSILTPSIEYLTPLSTTTFVTLGLSADRVGDGYAQTYFSVDAVGAVGSGLPVFTAEGGWKNYRISLFGGQLLTGDLRNPGLALFGGISYSKLLGDFKRSPIVSIAGDANQYLALLGISYSF